MTIISTLGWRVTRSGCNPLKLWTNSVLDEKWRQAPKPLGFRGRANAAIIGSGGMAEWLKAAVLKTVNGATRSGVRIPLPPPDIKNNAAAPQLPVVCVSCAV